VHTPDPCGPLSRLVVSHLRAGRGPTVTSRGVARLRRLVHRASDPLHDRDLQLALACCYELHYGGFDDVADDLEWDPTTLAVTGVLERALESALRAAVTHDGVDGVEPAEVPPKPTRDPPCRRSCSATPRTGTSGTSSPSAPSTTSRRPIRTPG
jgi:hypothetical protein